MAPLAIAILSWALLILVIEGAMWQLFRHKFSRICPPSVGEDRTIFHFFSIGRIRLFAILHTAVLLSAVVTGHLTLWS
jgi:hypothetical protein